MSKKTDQKFLENQHKRIEIISHLSAIAGLDLMTLHSKRERAKKRRCRIG